MRTYIYSSGMDKLSAQDGQDYLLTVTGFKLGDRVDFEFDGSDNTLPGNEVYDGGIDEMFYVPISSDQVMLQCIVSRDILQMKIGTVQIYVDDTPFCLSVADQTSFVKLERDPGNTVGTRYMYQLRLSIPQLTSRISFINLKTNVVRFKTTATEDTLLRWPWEEEHDQLVINTHSQFDAPIFLLNAWNDYWGCPLLARMDDDNMFWKITGGVTGDGHKYSSHE